MMPRWNDAGIENCGFGELVGFNGREDDPDLFDGAAYESSENMLECVILHAFDWDADCEHPEMCEDGCECRKVNLQHEHPRFGACLISCAWDPEDEGQYDRLENWEQPDWECFREEDEMVRRLYDFKDFIRKNDLGTITMAPEFINPNHETGVLSAIWVPDRYRLVEWAIAHPPSVESVKLKIGGW
jgi:hypothetical protein